MTASRLLAAAALWVVVFQPTIGAVSIGFTQAFDDPDHHWVVGAGPVIGTPTTVPRAFGGPGGPTDPFLSIVSTGGGGPLSRLSAQNFVEWAGNYLAAGVDRVGMDVNNLGAADVALRLLLLEFGVAGPVSAAFTSSAALIPAGSGWRHIEFDLSPAALIPIPALGVVDPLQTLSNVGELRIFHNPAPFFAPGGNPAIAAHLGVDNVTALGAVPEPATLMLAGGIALAGLRARRRSVRR